MITDFDFTKHKGCRILYRPVYNAQFKNPQTGRLYEGWIKEVTDDGQCVCIVDHKGLFAIPGTGEWYETRALEVHCYWDKS